MRDASAFLGAWAFAGVSGFGLNDLVAEYETIGIDGAALSPVEAVLQPEPMAANRRLLGSLADHAPASFTAWAVPIINPSLPGWEGHLAECLRLGDGLVRAVKLVPGYHDYALEQPAVDGLARACFAHGLACCIQVRMEDERMHHPRMHVPPVAAATVVALARRHPRLPILVCGAYMGELAAYRDSLNVRVEMSFLESGFTLRDALRRLSPDRLLIGTHTPIHMIAPNAAKFSSDELDEDTQAQLGWRNFDGLYSTH